MTKQNYTLIELIITCGIMGIILTTIIGGIVLVAVLFFTGKKIDEKGLKPMVEKVWKGPQKQGEKENE